MTRFLFAAAIAATAASAFAAAPAGPDTVVGSWHSPTKNAIIDIRKCGASLCGTLVTSDDLKKNPAMKDSKNSDPKLQGRTLKGMTLLSGFHQDGGEWVDGQVYKADDGKTYTGKITIVDATHLKVRGCIFVPLCKTEVWTRVQ